MVSYGDFQVPKYILRHLVRKGILTGFNTAEDHIFLKHFEKLYKNLDETVIKSFLKRLPKTKVYRMIETRDLNRVQLWVYTRYKKSNLPYLRAWQVASQASRAMKVKNDANMMRTVLKMRRRVYNERYRSNSVK